MLFLLKKICRCTLACFLFFQLFIPALADDLGENVLLRDGDLNIVVTKEDVVHYVNANVPPEERQKALSNPDSLLTLLQSIYIVRALALRADEFNVALDEEQSQWEYAFKRKNDLVVKIQAAAVAQAQEDVEWDAWAKEAYIGEPDNYMLEEEVDAAHILISTQDLTDEAALTLAKEVRTKALNGQAFNELATQYSSDTAANKSGGELGVFKYGAMVKPFANALRLMTKPGSVSEPVKTRFGYHIIKLNKKIPARKNDFEKVKPKIIKTLKARIAGQTRSQLLIATRSKPGVKVNEALLKDMRAEFVGEARQ